MKLLGRICRTNRCIEIKEIGLGIAEVRKEDQNENLWRILSDDE